MAFAPSGSKPRNQPVFVPGTKNEAAGTRLRNSLRFCPRVRPKRLREDVRRDSAARRLKPTTELEPTGMVPRQTSVKEWEYRELNSELAFWCCRVPPDAVSASPQGKAASEITGITASGPSGSEAFFFAFLPGKTTQLFPVCPYWAVRRSTRRYGNNSALRE